MGDRNTEKKIIIYYDMKLKAGIYICSYVKRLGKVENIKVKNIKLNFWTCQQPLLSKSPQGCHLEPYYNASQKWKHWTNPPGI